MAEIEKLKRGTDTVYPITVTDAVIDNNREGDTLSNVLKNNLPINISVQYDDT
jgi:hypothetical protein